MDMSPSSPVAGWALALRRFASRATGCATAMAAGACPEALLRLSELSFRDLVCQPEARRVLQQLMQALRGGRGEGEGGRGGLLILYGNIFRYKVFFCFFGGGGDVLGENGRGGGGGDERIGLGVGGGGGCHISRHDPNVGI